MATSIEPKSLVRPSEWSKEVENAYRFQLAGYRDETEYKSLRKVDEVRWFFKVKKNDLFVFCFWKRSNSGPKAVSWKNFSDAKTDVFITSTSFASVQTKKSTNVNYIRMNEQKKKSERNLSLFFFLIRWTKNCFLFFCLLNWRRPEEKALKTIFLFVFNA